MLAGWKVLGRDCKRGYIERLGFGVRDLAYGREWCLGKYPTRWTYNLICLRPWWTDSHVNLFVYSGLFPGSLPFLAFLPLCTNNHLFAAISIYITQVFPRERLLFSFTQVTTQHIHFSPLQCSISKPVPFELPIYYCLSKYVSPASTQCNLNLVKPLFQYHILWTAIAMQ